MRQDAPEIGDLQIVKLVREWESLAAEREDALNRVLQIDERMERLALALKRANAVIAGTSVEAAAKANGGAGPTATPEATAQAPSKQDRILTMLAKGIGAETIIAAVYHEITPETRKRYRAALHVLSRMNPPRVQRVGPSKWEVVAPAH